MGYPQIWNVLWSQQQGTFHLETMDQTLAAGMEALKANRATQYVLVATGFASIGEARGFTAAWVETIAERRRTGGRAE